MEPFTAERLRRERACLVDDDVPVALRGLPSDEVPQFFEAHLVVEGPRLVVGLVSPRAVQGCLFLGVEDAVGAGAQEFFGTVEAPEGLPGARRLPNAFDQAFGLAVAFQVAADRVPAAAPWGDCDEFLQQASTSRLRKRSRRSR